MIWSSATLAVSDDETDSPDPVRSSTGHLITDPAKVMGAESCKECHKSEHAAWSASMHAKNFERIDSSSGKKIAAAYGNTKVCQNCHSTPHTETAKFAGAVGVSCESCHSPAGGDEGWFKIHSDYGGKDVKREDETEEHLKERLAKCKAAGMVRPADANILAKNCYSCHIIADEKLLAAGHKTGQSSFDLIPWMQGEVRHNFQVDQSVNADSPSLLMARYGTTTAQRKRKLLVIGKIVELEICLRNLASIDAANLNESYAGRRGWAGRAEDAYEYLDEEIGEAVDNDQIKAALKAVKKIDLGRKFEDQPGAKAAANQLSDIVKSFAEDADADDLAKLDKLVDDLDKPKGTPYTP
ncbi:multiheme c-type cytochrome [Rubinisphaera italica]|uniref:Perchlorate reductase subunit gamma n=1 Tax=Rubinisphaera italica TaxID=2527969 RepID=A0A5C5XG21_9PLAN|nr:multiheme c-type cytochrome [Rubinisphaera italica]TWT61341.1 Perchlorate reductase subunit gamma precursor [Rubinisphaera italica]